ncbi:phosphodiesterase [Dactylosporangium vinaceum]|uniref:Phosphodiesterase n=1 Tax=Dactylosporangium vinaceum TaxID=53362 RepID=A0ABV5MDD5_9ACTN|nr:phosphodiesterase [Dactylosporangium vinaceum]UAC01192.1 phosphodiesterase [Dactylosporangium vinaceum]
MSMLTAAVRTAAHARGARLLHPRGRTFTGALTTFGTRGHRWGAALLDEPAVHPAVVRVSKGAPTPAGWPDVLGLAIRLPQPEGDVDLLLSSCTAVPVLRHLPWPRRDFGGRYGTLLAYRAGRRRVFLATQPEPGLGSTLDAVVRAAAGPGIQLPLVAASRWGSWRSFAVLRFGPVLDAGADAALAFDPIANAAPDLAPVGLVQRLRQPVYRASQQGRGR